MAVARIFRTGSRRTDLQRARRGCRAGPLRPRIGLNFCRDFPPSPVYYKMSKEDTPKSSHFIGPVDPFDFRSPLQKQLEEIREKDQANAKREDERRRIDSLVKQWHNPSSFVSDAQISPFRRALRATAYLVIYPFILAWKHIHIALPLAVLLLPLLILIPPIGWLFVCGALLLVLFVFFNLLWNNELDERQKRLDKQKTMMSEAAHRQLYEMQLRGQQPLGRKNVPEPSGWGMAPEKPQQRV